MITWSAFLRLFSDEPSGSTTEVDQVPTFSRALCLCQRQLHQGPQHPGQGPQEDRHH